MIAEIKQPTEKKAAVNPPVFQVRTKKYVRNSRTFYTTLFMLFFVAVAIILSLRSNQLYLKELLASGFILGYAFAMQIAERRLKVLDNDWKKSQNLN